MRRAPLGHRVDRVRQPQGDDLEQLQVQVRSRPRRRRLTGDIISEHGVRKCFNESGLSRRRSTLADRDRDVPGLLLEFAAGSLQQLGVHVDEADAAPLGMHSE